MYPNDAAVMRMAHATVLEQQQAGDEDDVSAGRLFGFVNIIAIFTSAATPRNCGA